MIVSRPLIVPKIRAPVLVHLTSAGARFPHDLAGKNLNHKALAHFEAKFFTIWSPAPDLSRTKTASDSILRRATNCWRKASLAALVPAEGMTQTALNVRSHGILAKDSQVCSGSPASVRYAPYRSSIDGRQHCK